MSRPRLLLACAVLACLAGPAVPSPPKPPSARSESPSHKARRSATRPLPTTPGPWFYTLTLPSTASGPIALIVEDLARERWAGRVLEPD